MLEESRRRNFADTTIRLYLHGVTLSTTNTAASRSLGSAGYCADVATAPGQTGDLSWTLHWPEGDRWLGYNVEVQVESR